MTSDTVAEKTALELSFLASFNSLSEEDPLFHLRKNAWSRFLEIGLPDRKSEVFRYVTRLRQFFKAPLILAKKTKTEKRAALVFVNGFFSPELSDLDSIDKRAQIAPLSRAAKTYDAYLDTQSRISLSKEKDPFAAINGALYGEGLFIYLPPKTAIEKPIEILHIIDAGKDPMLIQPRMHLFAGKNAEVEIISCQKVISGAGYAQNGYISFNLEDGARVRYIRSVFDEPDALFHMESVRAQLKRDSALDCLEVTDGSNTYRSDYHVALMGENGEANLSGVSMLGGTRHGHTHVLIEHVAPRCRSMQLFKNALIEKSRSSFEGKIFVHPEAQKTDAFQLNNNLLLSGEAQADCKPNLEIFADDVKASHGATFGQLDEEQLFYLKTRGLSQEDAENILIFGFLKEVIDKIDDPSLREEIKKRARRYSYGS